MNSIYVFLVVSYETKLLKVILGSIKSLDLLLLAVSMYTLLERCSGVEIVHERRGGIVMMVQNDWLGNKV